MSGGTSPNSWTNKDQTVAIWYDNQKNNWKIGPQKDHGTSRCWICSGTLTSNRILPHNIKNWYYLTGNDWISTSDVIIELKGKVIINPKILLKNVPI